MIYYRSNNYDDKDYMDFVNICFNYDKKDTKDIIEKKIYDFLINPKTIGMENLTQLVSYSISLINVLLNDNYNNEKFIEHKEIAEDICFRYLNQVDQIK